MLLQYDGPPWIPDASAYFQSTLSQAGGLPAGWRTAAGVEGILPTVSTASAQLSAVQALGTASPQDTDNAFSEDQAIKGERSSSNPSATSIHWVSYTFF